MATAPTRVPRPESGHEVLEATDARQGRWGRHALWILIASTTVAVIALFAVWAFYSDAFTTVDEAGAPTAAYVRQQAWAGGGGQAAFRVPPGWKNSA